MANVGAQFKPEIFRNDQPIIIATNRGSAVLQAVRLRYDSDGYEAGQVLARNTGDGLYEKYASGGPSGTDVAQCILFERHQVEDFDAQVASGSTMAVGIFGGCTVFYDKLIDIDSDAITDLHGRVIEDATGITTLLF